MMVTLSCSKEPERLTEDLMGSCSSRGRGCRVCSISRTSETRSYGEMLLKVPPTPHMWTEGYILHVVDQVLYLNLLPNHTTSLALSSKVFKTKTEWFIFWIKPPQKISSWCLCPMLLPETVLMSMTGLSQRLWCRCLFWVLPPEVM